MDALTPRQREVLALIRAHIARTGYPPTRADIARALGFRSANAAEEHLRALARKGAIEIAKGTSRGIRLADGLADGLADPGTDEWDTSEAGSGASFSDDRLSARAPRKHAGSSWQSEPHSLPIIGRVAAGAPILAVAHVESQFDIAPAAFRPQADYLLRVRGDSMMDIGIFDGDLLAVHAQAVAEPGQVIVARVDDEVTVKRLARGNSPEQLQLLAENPAFAPIVVDLTRQTFHIEGLAVGVLRTRI